MEKMASQGGMLEKLRGWTPPSHWRRISTLDAHTGGEPLRIVTGGVPDLPGKTILDRRRHMKEHHDYLRTALMWEPRGHREMYGCIVTPPVTADADFGVIFMHNEGYSTMCGHGIIAVATVAVTTGVVAPREPETIVRIDSPAGLVSAMVSVKNGIVGAVRFQNVPSFVVSLGDTIDVPDLGTVRYDLAFGGAFYAYVDARQLGLTCAPSENAEMVHKGMLIKRAIMAGRRIVHPFEEDLGFLYGTIFIAPPINHGADSRNVCIFADGEVDRSPTGTGVSGRMAIHYARHEVSVGQPLVIESIIGTTFTGRVVSTTTFGQFAAVIPEVEGTACISGRNEFWLDPADPLNRGFII
jgi:proline racemase